jgi:cardiolipin synthase
LNRMDIDPESELIFFEPAEYFRSLLEDIDRARDSIVLEAYIFEFDEIGRKFVNSLDAASKRGVEIRILVDGIGSYRNSQLIAEQLESDNCSLRIFHPLPWDFSAYRRALTSGRWYSQVLHFIASINHRDHRKLCLVDDRIAWLGSFNITADHFNNVLQNSDNNWHDTGLRVTGVTVQDLKLKFEAVWQRKNSSAISRTRKFLGRNLIRDRSGRNRRLIEILQDAETRIWICNAYFNPSFGLLRQLKLAANRGVDVRILVPSVSDIFVFPAITRTYYLDLLNAGIKVFEYRQRLLHSKSMIIDNRVIIGSTNLNYRSFFHDLELDALLTNSTSVKRMQEKYQLDIECSTEITLHSWKNYPRAINVLGWCSRFFRYWL